MKILAVGDIIGRQGCEYASANLRSIKKQTEADMVIVNAENVCAGSGLDRESASLLLASGADVLTGGNHSLRRYEIFPMLEDNDVILRPLNFPAKAPGKGYCIITAGNGMRILVISACGQVFMDPCNSPFSETEKLLNEKNGCFDFAVCDFHAEATSEKQAFAKYFENRIKIVYGTHTHVQTADEHLTPTGGAYISDIGMCGVTESIIGTSYDSAMSRFIDGIRKKGITAEGPITLCGALFTIDDKTGYVTDIKRIKYEGNEK